jgi:hypothetical protein
VKCDALLVDTISRSDTYPYVDIREDDVSMGHEATVSKISDDQLFYLMSRGLTEDEAMAMIVRGFIEPIAKELPMEYALELNRLIELQMEGRGRMHPHLAPPKTKSRRCARLTSPTSRPARPRGGVAVHPAQAPARLATATVARPVAAARSSEYGDLPAG